MNHEKIKTVALSLFAQHGYEGTTLADIAKGVGIKKPSIYNHFASKDDLFLTLLDEAFQTEMKSFQSFAETEIAQMESVEEQLFAILEFYSGRYQSDEMQFFKRVVFFSPEEMKQAIHTKFMEMEGVQSSFLKPVFEAGIAAGTIKPRDTDDLLGAYYCLLDGLFTQSHYYDRETYQKRLQVAWGFFWEGIRETKKGE
ncbi:TetR/AcrR family transcriptional regulator [Brevibacillus dissolubilis]|uniref:TetR/AcrR family transcriptional regulator n=1 Tax=Brevibacillus dissolubilis TaxID=1844116 RepID=UPI001115FBB8|nr:TetR/AcrR family transcriptional regulator [Brevibacillus dissolubilis]